MDILVQTLRVKTSLSLFIIFSKFDVKDIKVVQVSDQGNFYDTVLDPIVLRIYEGHLAHLNVAN